MIFVDQAKIFLKAGSGGQGCESYYRDKWTRYPRPDGGDGGKGGDIIVRADKSIHTLLDFRYNQHYKAKSGGHGSSKGQKGKSGEDCILRVPLGTIVRDHETGLLIKDLVADQQSVTVAVGGKGGNGNIHKRLPTPFQKGEERNVEFELKLIADVGIVGFPNAGKSTFISQISNVKSKIANYPFTTKQPILGIVTGEGFKFIIADLPGIIEGAHEGKGLGIRFLRHAERTKVLLHMIDMGGTEGRDPLKDYEQINHELKAYSEDLWYKEKIVVANKMDVPEAKDHLKRFKRKYKKEKILQISALEKTGLKEAVQKIVELLCQNQLNA